MTIQEIQKAFGLSQRQAELVVLNARAYGMAYILKKNKKSLVLNSADIIEIDADELDVS